MRRRKPIRSRHGFRVSLPGCNGSNSSQAMKKPIRRIGGRLREPGSPGVRGAVSRMSQFIALSRSAALPNGASEADGDEII